MSEDQIYNLDDDMDYSDHQAAVDAADYREAWDYDAYVDMELNV